MSARTVQFTVKISIDPATLVNNRIDGFSLHYVNTQGRGTKDCSAIPFEFVAEAFRSKDDVTVGHHDSTEHPNSFSDQGDGVYELKLTQIYTDVTNSSGSEPILRPGTYTLSSIAVTTLHVTQYLWEGIDFSSATFPSLQILDREAKDDVKIISLLVQHEDFYGIP